jgi:Glycosyl hydrolase family 26
MHLSRRSLLSSVSLAAVAGAVGATPALAESYPRKAPIGRSWCSGAHDTDLAAFAEWRGSPVTIAGMFGDGSVDAQLQQWEFAHTPTFSGDVDLAVGGPIGISWAKVAAGGHVAHWKKIAAVLRKNWHYRTVYLRYAHEMNGNWFKWSVPKAQAPAFRQSFRLFATTMRRELAGHNVKIVWAPNFGSWTYSPELAWPGPDVVDVVGLSIYEWALYDTQPKWQAFLKSTIGPNYWSAFAKKHGRPLAFSEWGAQSPLFVRGMNAWMRTMAGTGPGQLLYDVYLNGDRLDLTGDTASQYQALRWGSTT